MPSWCEGCKVFASTSLYLNGIEISLVNLISPFLSDNSPNPFSFLTYSTPSLINLPSFLLLSANPFKSI
jgi:hypothetical protein